MKSKKFELTGYRIMLVLILGLLIGMVGLLTAVSTGIDAHQKEHESQTVSLRLARVLEFVGEELAPTTVWDEAVAEMSAPTNPGWFDNFMGDLYTTRQGHVATFGFDSSGRLVRASHQDGVPDSKAAAPFLRAARPLVDQLRAQVKDRDRSTHGKAAVRFKSAFVDVDGTIYVIGVSTIVRHSPNGLVPDADPMVASVKSFDNELKWLRNRLGATGARFQPGAGPPPNGMAGLPIMDVTGAPLGQIVWTPKRPGQKILTHTLPLLILMLALLIGGGGILVLRMAADVRRLSASEAALCGALKSAEAANTAKSRFLSNVSHELRTPLNGVLGMAEILSMDELTPRQHQHLNLLKASGQRQLQLIEELLDVVRLDDGEVKLLKRPFRPAALMRRLASDYRGAAAAKGLELKVEAVKGEWVGDEVHIEKLLKALVHNAIRFTESGQVVMRIVEQGGLVFEVQDTGPGMTTLEVGRLFEPFAQRDESSTRTAEGLGLGLTVANGLAQLMGGRIEVDSTPGVGSLFRVVLPLQPAVRSSEAEAA